MRVILASNNENKLREMQAILSPLGWEILRQKDVGLHLEPDENGTTFEENSKIKAVAVMEASGLPAIADDSGVAVDALHGDPGVHSARYGGEKCKTDEDRNQYLLRNPPGESSMEKSSGRSREPAALAMIPCFISPPRAAPWQS